MPRRHPGARSKWCRVCAAGGVERGGRRAGVLPADVVPTDRPTYYLIDLSGPLLEEWRAELATSASPCSSTSRSNSYKALLPTRSRWRCAHSPSSPRRRPYGREDTGVIVRAAPVAPSPGAPDLRSFDLRLQPDAARDVVLQWLAAKQLPVTDRAGARCASASFADSDRLLEVQRPAGRAQRRRVRAAPASQRPRAGQARHRRGRQSGARRPAVHRRGSGRRLSPTPAWTTSIPTSQGRIVGVVALGRPGDTSDPHGHGTHVAGSVLGDGSASGGQFAGVAPEAQPVLPVPARRRAAASAGLPVALDDLFERPTQRGRAGSTTTAGARRPARCTRWTPRRSTSSSPPTATC